MAQLTGPTAAYQVADRLLDAINAALTTSLGGAPNRACVVESQIAWDECDCGTLAIAFRRSFLSDDFPEDLNSLVRVGPCPPVFVVAEHRIQIIRCAPSPQGQSLSVPCELLDASAQIIMSDAYVTLTTATDTLCQMKYDEEIVDFLIGDQTAESSSGACVGSELTVYVNFYRG